MKLRLLEPRATAVTLAAAAALGLLVGALIGAAGGSHEGGAGAELSAGRPEIPPFVVRPPTSTPRPDHPSPDLGNLTGLRQRNGAPVLLFDRVTLRGSDKTGYTVDNQGQRIRQRRMADVVKVIGGEKLTRQPEPKDIPLETLLSYLTASAKDDPLLVWLQYDDDGRIAEIREQNLP
jgi:hypothetical protein